MLREQKSHDQNTDDDDLAALKSEGPHLRDRGKVTKSAAETKGGSDRQLEDRIVGHALADRLPQEDDKRDGDKEHHKPPGQGLPAVKRPDESDNESRSNKLDQADVAEARG